MTEQRLDHQIALSMTGIAVAMVGVFAAFWPTIITPTFALSTGMMLVVTGVAWAVTVTVRAMKPAHITAIISMVATTHDGKRYLIVDGYQPTAYRIDETTDAGFYNGCAVTMTVEARQGQWFAKDVKVCVPAQ